ncbi:tryptophan-rich sensory protein [soil metagenome]
MNIFKFKILKFGFLCLLLGLLSAYISNSGSDQSWFQSLNKPSFNPPGWVFSPVWSVLYLMMGTSLGIIRYSENKLKQTAIAVFSIQFLLNFSWSIVFFKFHMIGTSLIIILLLFMSILLTIFIFKKINRTSAFMLIPYFLWVSFASMLNVSFWILNKGL